MYKYILFAFLQIGIGIRMIMNSNINLKKSKVPGRISNKCHVRQVFAILVNNIK